MKKLLKIFMPIMILTCITTVFATTYKVAKATFPILINGEKWESKNPIITINDKTYLPLAEIGEILDVDISWNEKLHQVEINDSYYYDYEDDYDDETEEDDDYLFSVDWYLGIDDDSYLDINYSNEDTDTTSTSKNFVGSKSSKKYHLPTCTWAKKTKTENREYFSTKLQAESLGYSACSSCKP